MLTRDSLNIIVQPGKEDPTWQDAGDSLARTGIMAMCGSEIDKENLSKFINDDNLLVRHPTQTTNTGTHPHNDPRSVSRDQLIGYAAGLLHIKRPTRAHAVVHYYASKWFVNKDFLAPDVRLMLYKASGYAVPLHIYALGYPMAFLTLLWHCFIRPDEEKNQAICQMSVLGPWWLGKLLKWHPDLGGNLVLYWGGWRDQIEIADELWKYIYQTVYGDF